MIEQVKKLLENISKAFKNNLLFVYYTSKPVTIAQKLTKVAVSKIFNPCFATRFPFLHLIPSSHQMIPIEELANETRKTDIIAVVRSVKWKLPFANSVIATNSFVTSLVAMILRHPLLLSMGSADEGKRGKM